MKGTSRWSKPSPALLVAVVALVAALGGGAVAGVTVNALNKKEKEQVKRISKKQAKKQIEKVPTGPRGEQGPKGDDGAPGPKGDDGDPAASYWAVVNSDGSLVRGSADTTAGQLFKPGIDGSYEVDFGIDVSQCSLLAGLGRTDAANLDPLSGEIGTAYRSGNAEAVYVKTRDSSGAAADRSFHLAAIC